MSAALPGLLCLRRRPSRWRRTLREVADYKGDALVQRMLQLIDEHKPLHLSIVGGEPLVRYRELNTLLPMLSARGLHTQVVTSAVRPIPIEWARMPRLQIVVSIDGLQPEHDVRRAPATYDRILKHIEGQQIIVHCTVTRQLVQRPGYLEEFVKIWRRTPTPARSGSASTRRRSARSRREKLTPADREQVVGRSADAAASYPKIKMPKGMIEVYRNPPASPDECVFAADHDDLSADLERRITPCQFGGSPDCANCGCIASAGSRRWAATGSQAGSRSGQFTGLHCGSGSGRAGPCRHGRRRRRPDPGRPKA